jgi:hypothetical protein
MSITHDYLPKQGGFPLPTAMMMDFGKFLSEGKDSEYKVRLYSDLPFPWRQDKNVGAQDDFEKWALQELRKNSSQAVWRFEGEDGQKILRYARADRVADNCVDCPPNTWKVDTVLPVKHFCSLADIFVGFSAPQNRGEPACAWQPPARTF